MKYIDNIEKATKENNNFRQVLSTNKYSQLVVMSLLPGEEIGAEVHPETDQFIRIEEGQATVILAGEETKVEDDFAIIIPAGMEHNVINTGNEELKLYTIYSPAHHPDGTIHKNKAEAEASEAAHHH